MKRCRPPLMASWLLEIFCARRIDESLIGDLFEEYALGRSRAWYWGQVLSAVSTSFWAHLRANLLLTIKAVITGWLAARLFEFAGLRIMVHLHLMPTVEVAPSAVGSGVSLTLICLALWFHVWVASGWFIGRLYRKHLTTVAMAFSISVFAWKLQTTPGTVRLFLETFANPRYFSEFLFRALTLILPSICVVLGALIASRIKQEPDQVRSHLRLTGGIRHEQS